MRKILQEPLVHFLLIGGGLFFLYNMVNPAEEQIENNVILLMDSDVERLAKSYQQNWNVPPDSSTLKKLLAEEIKAEVFYREALRMQLDHNDEIIRRRLKQKYEFLIKDLASNQQVTEAELQAFYKAHPELYKKPTTISFSQIYYSPDKRKQARSDAQNALKDLVNKAPSDVNIKKLSDPFHLQNYFANRDYNDVRQLFGQSFSKSLFQVKKEGWTTPIQSGYGVHLVYISSIQEEAIKPYETVKDKVLSDWKIAQQEIYNEQLYDNLLEKYEVKYDLEKWKI